MSALDDAELDLSRIIVEVVNPETPFGGVQIFGVAEDLIQVEFGTGGPIAGPEEPEAPTGPETPTDAATARGIIALVPGQSYIQVPFSTPEPDDQWLLVECSIVNDTDPDPLNILAGILTEKLYSGFRLQLSGMPDTGNYYLHWAISGFIPFAFPATSYRLDGPTSGVLGSAATFTVSLPPGGTVDVPVVVTPDDGGAGGTFSPTTVTLTTTSYTRTFTYTPASYGAKTISTTNDGSLTDPADLTFTSLASTYTLSGPSTGASGVPSTNFTVALPAGGVVAGTVTVTPHDAGDGGTFTPTTVNLTTSAPSATFTYTPVSGGAKTLSVTNDGGLTNPGNSTYTATVPATPHLLDTLISYWKMDETGGTAVSRVDSQGSNTLSDPTNCASFGGANAIINNAVYFGGSNRLTHVSNSSLQVTSDFTFSLWVRQDGGNVVIWKGEGSTGLDYTLGFDATYGLCFMAYIPATGINGTVGVCIPFASLPGGTGGVYHHVVAWYDSSDGKVRMRINDATTYTSTGTVTLVQTTNDFMIGQGQYGGSPNPGLTLTGVVDEVGFWKRVLTPLEITALYNSGAGLPYSSFTA